MKPAVSVAVFSLRLMTMRPGSAKAGRACEALAFGSSSAKEVVRARCGNVFEECCKRLEAPVLRIATQERELRAVIRVGVDLTVIKLDRADRLRGWIDGLSKAKLPS